MNSERQFHLIKFYEFIAMLESTLGGTRKLSECSGRMIWPLRGIYFFKEHGERCTDSGQGPRIVRIGTHALKAGSKTKLWSRLSQHKGHTRSGGGNHRGSIFRLVVGTALIKKNGSDCSSWDQPGSATREIRNKELNLEQAVSAVIGDMPFLWLSINDDPGPKSLRGYIERNAIALLSNYEKKPIDPPSENWLGKFCSRERMRKSGLWNSNHVDEAYDPAFLETLERLIDQMKINA